MTGRWGLRSAAVTERAPAFAGGTDPRAARWERLERLIGVLETGRATDLTAGQVRELTQLYRAASSDLLEEVRRDESGQAAEYLRSLVARGHSVLDRGAPPAILPAVVRFFADDFPATVRKHVRVVLLVVAVFVAGTAFGAWRMATDPSTGEVLLPFGHRYMDPEERVRQEERDAGKAKEQVATGGVPFAAQLFEHNSQVTYFAFGLAVTGGIGTVLLEFANGAYLGAVAVKYVEAGKTTFLVAWIGPHGVLELPAIFLGGAAGLLVARALFAPGLRGRRIALGEAGRDALLLLLGATATLLVAGAIEGTISQLHEPVLPYEVKIAFAAVVFACYVAYLSGAVTHAVRRIRGSARKAVP